MISAIPVFFTGFLFWYVKILNKKINKHGRFLGYLYESKAFGEKFSINYFGNFRASFDKDASDNEERKLGLHISDVYFIVLLVSTIGMGLALFYLPS